MNFDFYPSFLFGNYVYYSMLYKMQETVLETRSRTKLLFLSAWGLWWVQNRQNTRIQNRIQDVTVGLLLNSELNSTAVELDSVNKHTGLSGTFLRITVLRF